MEFKGRLPALTFLLVFSVELWSLHLRTLRGCGNSASGVGDELGPHSCCPPDCRCSPLGAASPQCHENSTCVCRPGFVGYKCDRCQDNFFLVDGDTGCQECPTCYALVKEEVSCYT